ncbi:glycosyltransferase family 39 protein [Candidatus Mycobacterium methanotrophicum]|uniref:Glycosyltransferase family 39 protein n=1 Tax=Candidatus Mycobacterium methanotrophicum TaxID=2943498 RepID=A0ABY4QG51_9MYCO|nr:glycosyltransferase family 39 protein [Candidatus Mycobacterium methanotrophicum]UQX09809.1 glycosyltransferase family 39 protein [Candidatus Mycobacterium methanotrophicum]
MFSGYPRRLIATLPRLFLDPLIVAVLAATVSLAGASRPSFWYDEAATISASYSRSLSQLWQMLGDVDAVEGLYYLFMHGWFEIFPPTEFWSRVPSGLAIGGAAAGIVVLGKQLSSRTVAVASGVVCAILPRATWAGIEARPYALSMMAAVWLTVALVYAARRNNAWAWLPYGIVLAASVLLDVYLLLLSLVHVVVIYVFRPGRTVVTRFALTSVLAGCAIAPFLVVAIGQARQISWIAPIGRRTLEDVAIQQYFERSPPFTILSALIVAAAIAVWRFTSAHFAQADRQLLRLAIAWLVIPTAVLVSYSALIHPIYTPRYLAFTAPGVALVLGVCIGVLAVTPWAAAALISLLAIVAAPNYILAQRNQYAKYGMDYSQIADLITAKGAPGDCLLVNDTVTFMPAPMRPLMAARPNAYRKLIDLTLWQRATDRNDVFDTNLIPEVVAKPLSHCRVVWIITQADKTRPDREQASTLPPGEGFGATPAFAVPHELGFQLVERWQFNLVQVIKATR